jgi:NAD(P)-dependent dehydrogenase (short-subunit alcohol dehydrogenase family)
MELTASKLFSVDGRNALITGASSGIGLMMAEGLVVNGIGCLFLVSNDAEIEIAQVVVNLEKLAERNGLRSEIHGFAS